jgi:outer membrane protein OmpA-like peptidoglycan-associated protein
MAATVDRAAPRRLPAPAAAMTGDDRLEWRVPARFAYGDDAPEAVDDEALDALVAVLAARCTPGTLVVVGHTCALGAEVVNLAIGKRRARHARELLVAHGLPRPGLHTVSAAATRPEADNSTPAGRERNRRVTIACQPLRHDARGEE